MYKISHTIVVKKSVKGRFRVLVNGVQEGCEVAMASLANIKAKELTKNYPSAKVFLFDEIPVVM